MSSMLPIILLVWLIGALAVIAAGGLARLPGPGMQVLIFALAFGALAAARFLPRIRVEIERLGAAPLVAVHLTRFVGFYFLWFESLGRLPREWALPAGYGDIAVSSLAAVLLAFRWHRRHAALLTWNVLGLIDILLVVFGAARLNIIRPGSMRELTELPLGLLPTFLVPVIIASHVLIFVHARRWCVRPAQRA